jgi:hypothetical protein
MYLFFLAFLMSFVRTVTQNPEEWLFNQEHKSSRRDRRR